MFEHSAVVIGNGESRRIIDLQKLTRRIALVGCNAVHRDAIVDHLVCVDDRMVREALQNVNICETKIYVRDNSYSWHRKVLKNKNLVRLPAIPNQTKERIDQERNWGSGTFALLIGSQLPNIKTIYVLGFDLYGNGLYVNNLYKNTPNYSEGGSHAIDPSYWIAQSAKVFKYFFDTTYVIINQNNWKMPAAWALPNVKFEVIENFKKEFEV